VVLKKIVFEKRNLVREQIEQGIDNLDLIAEKTQLTEKEVLRATRNLLAVKRLNGKIVKEGEKRELYVYPKTKFTKVQYVLGIISLVGGLLSLATLSWIYPSIATNNDDFYNFVELTKNALFYATITINALGVILSIISVGSRRAIIGLVLFILSTGICLVSLMLIYMVVMGVLAFCYCVACLS